MLMKLEELDDIVYIHISEDPPQNLGSAGVGTEKGFYNVA